MICAIAPDAAADWSVNAVGDLHYTDDVALFSATRRLDLHGDPTQPVLDSVLTGKGSDMVFEPDLNVAKSFASQWGRTEVSVRGQAFVYTINPRFNHASVGIQALHEITPDTKIRVRFYSTPNLLLGDNESKRTDSLEEERVTSHIGSVRLEQRLSNNWELRLLARYGARLYNEDFAQRDTTFWTIGPHLVWHMTEHITLVLGYHYERGLADGRNQPALQDDVSYINHYGALGLEAEVTERLGIELGFHYERNNWTSGIEGDERKGGHETVVLGEINARYRLSHQWAALIGFQRSQRKQSFEEGLVHNTNVTIGASYQF
jgi:hypothetical protein